MRDVLEFRSPLGPLGVLVDVLVLKAHLRRLLEKRNEQIRSEAEALGSTHATEARAPEARPNQGAVVYLASNLVIASVGLVHFYILVLEMFLWDGPVGRRVFGMTPEKAAITKVLAANQGLYNGFLAAGLFFGLSLGVEGFGVKLFFLGCVLAAGLFGAATVSRRILFVQALPAAVGLAFLLAS